MTSDKRQTAIERHRAQIIRAGRMCRSGQWSPAYAACVRQASERFLRADEPNKEAESAG